MLQAIADRCRALGAYQTQKILRDAASLLALYEPEFATLPGAAPVPVQAVSAAEARTRLWDCLSATLRQLAEDQAVILVLDDLQWADELTLSWLEYLTARGTLALMRVLIIGTYRSEECPEALHRLIASSGVTSISLKRLEATDVASMVSDMLALRPSPPLFSRHLAQHSEGNPFFVAEYLRMAVGENLLTRDDAGRWCLLDEGAATDDVEARYRALPLPHSLTALVTRRFEGLTAEAATALAAAAVLGRETDATVLMRVSGLDDAGALQAGAELLRRQILEEASGGRLRFLHDKLREAAYDRVPGPHRRDLHHLAAQTLEADVLSPDQRLETEATEAHAAILAFHYLRAGVQSDAARYSWLAGRHATRASALPEAIAHFDTAVTIADQLGDEVEIRKLRIDARLDSYPARMHSRTAADDGLLRVCRDAEPLAVTLGDQRRLTRLYAYFAGSHFARAEYRDCIEVGQRGLHYAHHNLEVAAITGYIPSSAMLQAGEFAALVGMAQPIANGLERAGATTEPFGQPYPPYVCLAANLGWAFALTGRFVKSEAFLEKALTAAAESGSSYALSLAHAVTGWSACVRGHGEAAITHGRQAERMAHEARLPGPEMFGISSMGIGSVLCGRVNDGIALLENYLARADALKYVAYRSDAVYGLALGYLAQGNSSRVIETCQVGLQAAVAGERKLEAEFHRVLGEQALLDRTPGGCPSVAAGGQVDRHAAGSASIPGSRAARNGPSAPAAAAVGRGDHGASGSQRNLQGTWSDG